MNLLKRGLLRGIRAYRLLSSYRLPVCRFDPTCSQYAMDAIEIHGGVRGTAIATRRVLRCHPWGGCGYDPVPSSTREPEVQCLT
ncbi:MAG: membrane protein insertion efficiency factor YidD [Actinomycetota bacterium]|nr:membrane protein insertion efficiency factor YidD [Acidimicrobiales bacterium]MEC9269574.1 membrane protein insertion efficiency factor YidD [Actinomycetota bacterium]MEC9338574.1 membrane protein insertion efficiency factor YidD [Actinomycetota bacterium]